MVARGNWRPAETVERKTSSRFSRAWQLKSSLVLLVTRSRVSFTPICGELASRNIARWIRLPSARQHGRPSNRQRPIISSFQRHSRRETTFKAIPVSRKSSSRPVTPLRQSGTGFRFILHRKTPRLRSNISARKTKRFCAGNTIWRRTAEIGKLPTQRPMSATIEARSYSDQFFTGLSTSDTLGIADRRAVSSALLHIRR